jgi:hypothetical protein
MDLGMQRLLSRLQIEYFVSRAGTSRQVAAVIGWQGRLTPICWHVRKEPPPVKPKDQVGVEGTRQKKN